MSQDTSPLLLRLRYSTEPEADTIFEWEGSIFAFLPGQPPKRVFSCVGMNIGKAKVVDGKLQATGRELTYYLDPQTKQKLTHWDNPWTNEKHLPVVHIANDPVQMAFPVAIPLDTRTNPFSKTTKVMTEIPLFYPNPLATEDGTFDAYDAAKMYQAGELFTFTCPTSEAESSGTVENVEVNWTRMSRFAPFMKMGTQQGYLVYHCTGHKLPSHATVDQLQSSVLRDEIKNVVPAYARAPAAYDPAAKNVSSWSYFKHHFNRYQSDSEATWPVPAHE